MNPFDHLKTLPVKGAEELFGLLEAEIAEAVRLYWGLASQILEESGVRLLALPHEFLALRKNFFSALFLYSYHRAGIPHERRVVYAAVNHCLRGMVTGCDNLLDDEYKATLVTDLPASGTRFRSVLDIMVSDRVLFDILLTAHREGRLDADQVLAASSASLRALARSGAQEAGEEGGVQEILPPETILRSIHHFKTGVLFQCPWAVPQLIETVDTDLRDRMLEALYRIGIGCQILDDVVDVASDVRNRHHNYLVSLIHHEGTPEERALLSATLETEERELPGSDPPLSFPRALEAASARAHQELQAGLGALFPGELAALVQPVILILGTLIGAIRFMNPAGTR